MNISEAITIELRYMYTDLVHLLIAISQQMQFAEYSQKKKLLEGKISNGVSLVMAQLILYA